MDDATCICPKGFFGAHCEQDRCDDITCFHGADCQLGSCQCLPGFTGKILIILSTMINL